MREEIVHVTNSGSISGANGLSAFSIGSGGALIPISLLTRQLKSCHCIEKGLSPAALFRCSRPLFYCRVSSTPIY